MADSVGNSNREVWWVELHMGQIGDKQSYVVVFSAFFFLFSFFFSRFSYSRPTYWFANLM